MHHILLTEMDSTVPALEPCTNAGGLTINAAVLEASEEAVVLEDIQQTRHLAENQDSALAALQLRQQPIQQHHLPWKVNLPLKYTLSLFVDWL